MNVPFVEGSKYTHEKVLNCTSVWKGTVIRRMWKPEYENKFTKQFMGCGAETKGLIFEDEKDCNKWYEEFAYLRIKIDKQDV